MYTLREVKKADRKAVCNTSLGNQYHLVCNGSEGYEKIRNSHFLSMGFSRTETSSMKNPFIIHSEGSKEIYLYNGREYYIMTESGKTFENLSGLVGGNVITAKSESGEDLQFNSKGELIK
jgi:hypothetical protein